MTSRRATPAPVAPPNSNQARIDIAHVGNTSPVNAAVTPDHSTSTGSHVAYAYRRSQSPSSNISVQISKRNVSSPQRGVSSQVTPIRQQQQQQQQHHYPLQQQQQQHNQQRGNAHLYHQVISPPLSPSSYGGSHSTIFGQRQRSTSGSSGVNSQTISVQCSPTPSGPTSPLTTPTTSGGHSRIPIMTSPDGSTRIRQRLIIAPENSTPPSGLSHVTRANLAATVSSAAARRRSLSSRSSQRSSASEDSLRENAFYSSIKDIGGHSMTLPIRRLSSTSSSCSGGGGGGVTSPAQDSRYQEVAPPESFWSRQSSASPHLRRVIVPGSLALNDSKGSATSTPASTPASTPNKLWGLRYDTMPAKQSGPSPAELKLAELTSTIAKDFELQNIPIKSSKVTRYVSNGSLNSISDKSSSSQTSPSSRSDEDHPLVDRLNGEGATQFISGLLEEAFVQDHFYGDCNTCGMGVYGESNACEAMELIYHVKCFTCDECGRTLRDKAFYTVNGKVYCEEDYKYSGFQQDNDKCATCGHLIMDMQVLHAHNKTYHPSCFRCRACNVPLQSNPFITDKSNRVFCVKDYYKLHSPICNYCRRTIEPFRDTNETVKVVSRNRDYHVDCFHCHDCNLQLTSEDNTLCFPNKDGSRLYCGVCVNNHRDVMAVNASSAASAAASDENNLKTSICQLVISKNVPPQTLGGGGGIAKSNLSTASFKVTDL